MFKPIVRVLSCVLIFLFCSSAANAQFRWDGKEKHWYNDVFWWIGEGVIAGSIFVDLHSTSLVRDRCPGCVERNAWLGPHPTNRRLAIYGTTVTGLFTLFHAGLWHVCYCMDGQDRPLRVATYVFIPALVGRMRIPAAVHNYQLAARYLSSPPQYAAYSGTQTLPLPTYVRPRYGLNQGWATYRGPISSLLPVRLRECVGLDLCYAAPIPIKRDLRSVPFR